MLARLRLQKPLRGRSLPSSHARDESSVVAALALAAGAGVFTSSARAADPLSQIGHIVVIYEENHSFDNLYGGWEGVNGLSSADPAHTIQVNQAGNPFACLWQNDVNLSSPPLPSMCTDSTTGTAFTSAFGNEPFTIDQYIPASANTCPPPGANYPNGVLNGPRAPRRLYTRPRAQVLPGALSARRREVRPLRHRERRGRSHDGRLQHEGPADLPVPAPAAAPLVRDRGRLLPGQRERLVLQPLLPRLGDGRGFHERPQ